MSRERRQKLSDIFGTAYQSKGRRIGFAELYPEIDDLMVEIEIVGKTRLGTSHQVEFNKINYSNVYDCPNQLCGGGVRVDDIVSDMYRAHETTKEVEVRCGGFEGSPKGHKFYRYCANSFKVKVTIRYRALVMSSDNV